MKILFVGAGAIGGYFGGRLIEKGEDVTFLLRENRKQQLDRDGLIVESVKGDIKLKPKTLISGEKADDFDVVVLTTKAYQLDGAIEDIRPYVGESTLVLPLLNGIAHMPKLKDAFSEDQVIGGLCFIETTLDEEGKIIQTSPAHELVFGELSGEKTDRILRLQEAFTGTKADFRLSENIEKDMWHKYLFIVTLSGVTSLFRSPIGPIRDQESGVETIKNVLRETAKIMRASEAPIAEGIENSQLNRVGELGYGMKSSLQRDMEKNLSIEADHFFGYLLEKAEAKSIDAPVLTAIHANLKIYENVLRSK